MKNLRDYLKLIFAAVMSFIGSLLQVKRSGGKVPVEVSGNGVKERRDTGGKVYGFKDVSAAARDGKYMINSYELLHRKRNKTVWKIHRHRPWKERMISELAFIIRGEKIQPFDRLYHWK